MNDIRDDINNLQNYHFVKIKLVELLKEYSRIHISGVQREVDLPNEETIEIVKYLIEKGDVKAKYEEKTQGIESQYTMQEIDDLLDLFRKWEKSGEGKKN